MKELKLNGCKVLIYDSADNLPAENHIHFSRLAMLDAGIGGDLDSVMNHWKMLSHYIKEGKKEEAQNALSNYAQLLQFVVSNTNPEFQSFVPLIHSIDGEPLTDLSDENIKTVLLRLSRKGLTVGKIREILRAVKKKIDTELETYKLAGGISPETVDYYSKLKRRVEVICKGIQGKMKGYEKEVEEIDRLILNIVKPQRYGEKEVELIQAFDKNCLMLTKHMNIQRPERLPLRKFLTALKDLREQLKPNKNQIFNGQKRK